jgi:hypothetical protein
MSALPLKMIRPFCRTAKSPVLKKPSESNFWAVSSGECRYLLHCQQTQAPIKAIMTCLRNKDGVLTRTSPCSPSDNLTVTPGSAVPKSAYARVSTKIDSIQTYPKKGPQINEPPSNTRPRPQQQSPASQSSHTKPSAASRPSTPSKTPSNPPTASLQSHTHPSSI